MSDEQKKLLEQQLWAIANILRGKMDADDYRNYILGFIFFKYLSEKLEIYANEILEPDNLKYTDLEDTKDKIYIDAVKKSCIKKLGYFLKPSELFSSIANKGNNLVDTDTNENDEATQFFILEDLERILNNIEQSTMGTDSEDDFVRLFEDLDLNSSKLGKTTKAKNEIIAKILNALNKIDFQLEDANADILGDAYEYLIGEFAAGAGKKAGEFYTPQQVSTILAKIVTTRKKRLKSVYDPTCGSGSLLLRVAKEVDDVGYFYGQELNRTTYNLARMNMILHDVHYTKFDIKQGDTLEDDLHEELKAEAIVANPPFSAQWSAKQIFASDDRFSQYGRLAPKTKADFAFVQHMIHHLDDNGIMACVLPHGVLFRGAAEGHIRKYLIEDRNYLDAVIGLPSNIFFGTTIPTCILVFKKCREVNDSIIFIDSSEYFTKNKNKNILTDDNINDIVNAYKERKDINKFCHNASLEEVRANNYNINISRYIDNFVEDKIYDIDILVKKLKSLSIENDINNKKLAQYCTELKIEYPEGNNLQLLRNFKKSVMFKILNREIKFENDSVWIDVKLGNLVTFSKGSGLSKDDIVDDGVYKCIHYGELFTTYHEVIDDILSKTNVNFGVKSIKGDILMPASDVTPLGLATASLINESDVIIGGDIIILRKKKDFNNAFLSYLINFEKKKIIRLVTGSSIKHIYSKDLESINVSIPKDIKVQDKISDFFICIDKKINFIDNGNLVL